MKAYYVEKNSVLFPWGAKIPRRKPNFPKNPELPRPTVHAPNYPEYPKRQRNFENPVAFLMALGSQRFM